MSCQHCPLLHSAERDKVDEWLLQASPVCGMNEQINTFDVFINIQILSVLRSLLLRESIPRPPLAHR